MKISERNLILRSQHRVVDLSRPVVMAIINTTPDSFFLGSRFNDTQAVVDKVGEGLEWGAQMIDMGGMSSRPGAPVITAEEEADRLLPHLEVLRKHFPDLWISIDTWRSDVVSACLPFEIDMVNDISGGRFDDQLWPLLSRYRLPYVLMHMPNPLDQMHQKQKYENIIRTVALYFHEGIRQLTSMGVDQLVLDPGFGFGKSLADNYTLLNKMDQFAFLEYPLLTGISRKSMIQKVLGVEAGSALNGTTALNMVALQRGTRILRVHDVKEASECIRLYEQLSDTGDN